MIMMIMMIVRIAWIVRIVMIMRIVQIVMIAWIVRIVRIVKIAWIVRIVMIMRIVRIVRIVRIMRVVEAVAGVVLGGGSVVVVPALFGSHSCNFNNLIRVHFPLRCNKPIPLSHPINSSLPSEEQ